MKVLDQVRGYLEMKRQGRLSSSGLAELQDARLRRLVTWAYERVPYYRRLFEANGLRPGDIQGVSDLDRIPVTTKARIQSAEPDLFMARGIDPEQCVRLTTSGSTGVPLRLTFTKRDFSRTNMNWFRPQRAWGIRPHFSQMEITGPHNFISGKAWYQRLGAWKREQVSVFRPVAEWAALWNRLKPDVLWGYSGSLVLLARQTLDHGPLQPQPKFVVGVSDLCSESDRETIRKALGCELIDLYGAAETGCLAWTCPSGEGSHINSDTVIVQVCRDGRTIPAGESGNIIVTNLLSQAMPIIRYDLGDIGRLSPRAPDCGRSLPLLEVLEGRADGVLRLPSGRRLSPMFFYGVMKPMQGIKAWRVVQETSGALSILVVPDRNAAPSLNARLKLHVEERLGEQIPVDVVAVDDIPLDPSGKVRAVISRLAEKEY